MRPRHLLLALLCAAAAALAAAPAAAPAASTPFCVGMLTRAGTPCYDRPRLMRTASAIGQTTAVCVGADSIAGTCSSGPGQIAVLNLGGAGAVRVPWVVGVASAWTLAFAETSYP